MKAQTMMAVAAALLVGALLGYFVPQLTAKAPEPETKAEKTTEKRRDRSKQQPDHAADLNRLRARIASGRAFAILPDLRVPAPDTEVPFLNGTANVSHGGAMFAVTTGAPVVVAIMRRENGLHTFDHLATLRPDPDAPDRKEEARRLMREAMALIDEGVRKTPEQWFWYNSRWILQPPRKKKRKHTA